MVQTQADREAEIHGDNDHIAQCVRWAWQAPVRGQALMARPNVRGSQIHGFSGVCCKYACARSRFEAHIVMAGPIHCRTVLEGSWERSREAQFEAQTRFRAVAGPKGRTPSLQRRENAVRTLNDPGPTLLRDSQERGYTATPGGLGEFR